MADDTAMTRWQNRQQQDKDGWIEKDEAIDKLEHLSGTCHRGGPGPSGRQPAGAFSPGAHFMNHDKPCLGWIPPRCHYTTSSSPPQLDLCGTGAAIEHASTGISMIGLRWHASPRSRWGTVFKKKGGGFQGPVDNSSRGLSLPRNLGNTPPPFFLAVFQIWTPTKITMAPKPTNRPVMRELLQGYSVPPPLESEQQENHCRDEEGRLEEV